MKENSDFWKGVGMMSVILGVFTIILVYASFFDVTFSLINPKLVFFISGVMLLIIGIKMGIYNE